MRWQQTYVISRSSHGSQRRQPSLQKSRTHLKHRDQRQPPRRPPRPAPHPEPRRELGIRDNSPNRSRTLTGNGGSRRR